MRRDRRGILKYAHDSDGTAVEGPDLSDEREQLEREQRKLSRKDHGSANYRKQQRVVARRHADLKRKRRDFLYKLSNYYAREYHLVTVEDFDAKGLMEILSKKLHYEHSRSARSVLIAPALKRS